MPTKLEPALAEALPAAPSHVMNDDLIEEDCESMPDMASAAEAFQAAAINFRSTAPYIDNSAHSDDAAPQKDCDIANLTHDIGRENRQVDDYDMISDTMSESKSDNQDLLSDTLMSQSSAITAGSLLSEDVWSLPDSPSAFSRPDFTTEQKHESFLSLGSPPSSSIAHIDYIEASLGNKPSPWHVQSEESHRNANTSERSDALQQSLVKGTDIIMDHDEEEVYDF